MSKKFKENNLYKGTFRLKNNEVGNAVLEKIKLSKTDNKTINDIIIEAILNSKIVNVQRISKEVPEEEKKLVKNISAIGNNLNQIARFLNYILANKLYKEVDKDLLTGILLLIADLQKELTSQRELMIKHNDKLISRLNDYKAKKGQHIKTNMEEIKDVNKTNK